MSIKKPFKRTIRPFIETKDRQGGLWHYIKHPNFADSPEHYLRAYFIIQKDFISLLDFIEPADINITTYSFRIQELLFRICVEIETNCKAILKENGYSKKNDWNMKDYKKINKSHKLSMYEVRFPIWNGKENIRKPFANWDFDAELEWWGAYNNTKHNRHSEFEIVNFKNLTDAICGLIIILSAQFKNEDFTPKSSYLCIGGGPSDGMESSIGGYFRIKYPDNWVENEKYDFNWNDIKDDTNPIDNYKY